MIVKSKTTVTTQIQHQIITLDVKFNNPLISKDAIFLRLTPINPISKKALYEYKASVFIRIKEYDNINIANEKTSKYTFKNFKGHMISNAIFFVAFNNETGEIEVYLPNFYKLNHSDILKIYEEIVDILSIF